MADSAAPSSAIRDRLIAKGSTLVQGPAVPVVFTKDEAANHFLNDLGRRPHAFVLGCIVDRQVPTERAWMIPYLMAQAIGDDSFDAFARLSAGDIRRLLTKPKKLHRFPEIMAANLHAGVERIVDSYGGDASRIWADRPSSAELVLRFLEFRGVGQKIATMAANILARHFKVPLADHFSIDVSADVHVRRVFGRLGLVSTDASPEQVIYRARALSPHFPGLLDSPCFTIGREWCRPKRPLCDRCYMADLCPSAGLA